MLDEEKPTTAGELKLSDLPAIEELTITLPVNNLVKIGKVLNIVDVLVVIESIRSMPPLDLDTVLFKSNGKPIGQIFDVFGPIVEPHYSIRFSKAEQIKEKDIHTNMDVYFAPQKDRNITKFAFVNEIKKIKGTDASWEHDNEPPESVVEYSDDEEERKSRKRNPKRSKPVPKETCSVTSEEDLDDEDDLDDET